MTREIAIKTAAKWWADKLRARAPHDNGANDPSNRLAMMLADILTTPMSEEQLNRFRKALEEGIDQDLKKYGEQLGGVMGCDYGPCSLLSAAAEQAGINFANFPYKTHLHIKNNGDYYTVLVSDGYAQPFEKIKPCE